MSKRHNYRKIYEQHHGPIPEGYEVHHIDGDYNNNYPDNLRAVSPREHYDIHYKQGDYGACWAMTIGGYIISPKKLSELARKQQKQMIENGTHIFLDSEWQRHNALKRMKDGTHNFLTSARQYALQRYAKGTHNFIAMSSTKHTCPHCGTTGKGSPMYRWHYDRCRSK